MDTVTPSLLYQFLIALFIGALVGLEREKKKRADGDLGLGGIRTFILVAMAGAVAGWLSVQLETPWVFAASLLIVAALVLAGYILTVKSGPPRRGSPARSAPWWCTSWAAPSCSATRDWRSGSAS